MLDIAPTSDSSPGARMPRDFTPYLLSASPPGSVFDFHNFQSFASGDFESFSPLSHFESPHFESPESQACGKAYGNCSLNSRRNGPLKSIILKSDSDGDLSSGATSDGESTPTSPCSPGRMRKRVSFADHCGKALAQVRIMSEASDEPPRFKPELLATITQGATASVTDKPPLKLTFSQPASDYLAFRDKIEKNLVSLENVILNDYTVVGTIKVKNVSFKKKVFVRYTYTSWESHEDVVATYVRGPGDIPGRPSCHDTFTFEFEVPPTSNVSKSVEFAVCYDADGTQHWDSNGGANYGIVWEVFREPTPPQPVIHGNDNNNNPFVFGPSTLTDFACWHHIDTSTPYY